jgi:hypothetical protein
VSFDQWIDYKIEWDFTVLAAVISAGVAASLYWHFRLTYQNNNGRGTIRFIRRIFGSSQLEFEETLERERRRREHQGRQ